MSAMVMNLSANMLGLSNNATPLGLKAMGHLQELNPHKQSASNAMITFLALNTGDFAAHSHDGDEFPQCRRGEP